MRPTSTGKEKRFGLLPDAGGKFPPRGIRVLPDKPPYRIDYMAN